MASVKTLTLSLVLLFSFISSPAVYASHEPGHTGCNSPSFFGIPSWDVYLKKDVSRGCAVVDFSFPGDLWLVVLGLLDILFRLSAYMAIAFIFWGAWKIIGSQGSPDGIKNGRDTILNAIIGLVVTIAAAVIVRFVAGKF